MPAGKRILIYRLGSLGDTIAALPVFNKITETFPGADISLLTNKPIMAKAAAIESVLGGAPFFNRVLDYPVGTRSLKLLFNLIKQIRRYQPDTVCYLAGVRTRGSMRTTKLTVWRDRMFFRAAGIRHFVGFPQVEADFALSVDAATGEFEWEPKRLARRFKSLGEINLSDEPVWNLRFTPQETAGAKALMATFNADGLPVIVASTGSKKQTNDWEQHNWTAFFEKLGRSLPNWHLIMLGAPDEADRASLCLKAWGGSGGNLCGKTSPRVSAAILKYARVFIGHDSGPMHLAACVGVPCVSVFSARSLPRQWYPRGNGNKIIYHKTDCAGCGIDICIEQKKKCILSITVDEVHEAVMQVLNLKDAPNASGV